MRKKLFTSLLLLCVLQSSCQQPLSCPVGARATGSGHSGIVHEDLWGAFNNQAAVASLKNIQAGVFLENRFLVDEMNRIATALYLPLNSGGIIISVDHFGSFIYSEMKAGLGYSMQMAKLFSAGVQLDFLQMSIGEGYGKYLAVTFEGGMLAKLTEKLKLGIHVINPINTKWIGTEEQIPSVIRGGFGYKPESSLELYAEVHKSTNNPVIFCAGTEYRYHEKFFIRAGITSGPSRYTFGAGFMIKSLKLDISSSVHSWLGYSPQL
ncbi:MAG: hypothetical protein ABFS05_06855, partial [Bacteroidota bacterium]